MNRRTFFELLGSASVALGLSTNDAIAKPKKVEARLRELGIELKEPATPVAVYVPYRISGNQVFIGRPSHHEMIMESAI